MNGENHFPMPAALSEEINRLPDSGSILRVWDLTERAEPVPSFAPDADAAWKQLTQRLEPSAPRRKRAANRAPHQRRRLRVGLALAGLSVVVVGLFVWTRPVSESSGPGGHRTVTLPDGSTVELNSDSRISYARGFRDGALMQSTRRVVTVEGEAFFNVVHTGRPFIVRTFNARVEVLGTQFNVRARQGGWDHETRVTLAEGHVQVQPTVREASRNVIFDLTRAGEEVRVAPTATGPVPAVLPLTRRLAWRTKGFVAINRPLGAILEELERRYALVLGAEEGLALSEPLTLFYLRSVPVEAILQDICLAQHCRYRKSSRGYILSPASGTP